MVAAGRQHLAHVWAFLATALSPVRTRLAALRIRHVSAMGYDGVRVCVRELPVVFVLGPASVQEGTLQDPRAAESHSQRIYRREEIRRRLRDPSLVIGNVLPRPAFEQARIPGSLCLPLEEISARSRDVLPDPGQEVALYCGGPT